MNEKQKKKKGKKCEKLQKTTKDRNQMITKIKKEYIQKDKAFTRKVRKSEIYQNIEN